MLTCNIIKDLLPNYIDKLVSEETAQEIEAHLAECADCRDAVEQMTAPLTPLLTQEDEAALDFLKKVQAKNWRRVFKYSAGSAALILFALLLLVYFLSGGTSVQSADLRFSVRHDLWGQEDANAFIPIHVSMHLINGYHLLADFEFSYNQETNQLERYLIIPRQIPRWLPRDSQSHTGFGGMYIPREQVADDFVLIIRFADTDFIFTVQDIWDEAFSFTHTPPIARPDSRTISAMQAIRIAERQARDQGLFDVFGRLITEAELLFHREELEYRVEFTDANGTVIYAMHVCAWTGEPLFGIHYVPWPPFAAP